MGYEEQFPKKKEKIEGTKGRSYGTVQGESDPMSSDGPLEVAAIAFFPVFTFFLSFSFLPIFFAVFCSFKVFFLLNMIDKGNRGVAR